MRHEPLAWLRAVWWEADSKAAAILRVVRDGTTTGVAAHAGHAQLMTCVHPDATVDATDCEGPRLCGHDPYSPAPECRARGSESAILAHVKWRRHGGGGVGGSDAVFM